MRIRSSTSQENRIFIFGKRCRLEGKGKNREDQRVFTVIAGKSDGPVGSGRCRGNGERQVEKKRDNF